MGMAVDRLIALSTVKAHTRTTHAGKVVRVKQYDRLFHVAPRAARASIEKHGIDTSRGQSPWANAPVGFRSQDFPKGNYFFTDLDEAKQYRVYSDPMGDVDIWQVDPQGITVDDDPMKVGVLVKSPIPASRVRRVA